MRSGDNAKYAHNVFFALCFIAAFSAVVWCCYEFSRNEDVCEICYKQFNEDNQSIYPDLTLCIPHKFDEEKLDSYVHGIDGLTYSKFLTGQYWYENMKNVNFEDVRMKLENYLLKTLLVPDITHYILDEGIEIKTITNFSFPDSTCYTFHLSNFSQIFDVEIILKNSIFPNGIRPTMRLFYVAFHYPNQIFRSFSNAYYQWSDRNDSKKYYQMRFIINSMEVLRRRQKYNQPCYDEKLNYDNMIVEDAVRKIGCNPPYYNFSTISKPCDSKDELMWIHVITGIEWATMKHELPPCAEIQKMAIEYYEDDLYGYDINDTDNEGWFKIMITNKARHFKEIKQTRAYSLQSLVGNVGGYIGLFLGYAIMDLPPLINSFVSWIKNRILK